MAFDARFTSGIGQFQPIPILRFPRLQRSSRVMVIRGLGGHKTGSTIPIEPALRLFIAGIMTRIQAKRVAGPERAMRRHRKPSDRHSDF